MDERNMKTRNGKPAGDGDYRHVMRLVVPMVLSNAAFTVMPFTDRVLVARFSSGRRAERPPGIARGGAGPDRMGAAPHYRRRARHSVMDVFVRPRKTRHSFPSLRQSASNASARRIPHGTPNFQ